MRNANSWALVPVMILSLAACSGGEADNSAKAGATPAASSKTLAVAIGDEGDLDLLAAVIANAGLSDVLQGKGPYTVFAPANTALGASGADLSGEAMKAQSAALLRAHIVPGAITRTDIIAAIERGGGGGIQMRTMADGLLTFSKDGDVVVVTGSDGAVARLTGQETVASNGVVQPIDGVLVQAK